MGRDERTEEIKSMSDINEIEHDQTKETWNNVYKKLYSDKSKIFEIYDIENYVKKDCRNVAYTRKNNKNDAISKYFSCSMDSASEMENKNYFMRISGELDFNFRLLRKVYIRNQDLNQVTKNRIEEYYNKKLYCDENFSLMLCAGGKNGGLQAIKGQNNKYGSEINGILNYKFNIYDDICAFINRLNEYFYLSQDRTINNKLFNKVHNSNKEYMIIQKECLSLYLNLFNDIYEYCYEIYRIDEKMTNKMIDFAKKKDYSDINQEINDWLDISDMFFEQKSKFIKNQ